MNREACAIVLTRGDGQRLEIFLALRSLKLAFLGGFHAFPGGGVAKVDRQVEVANASPELPAHIVSCAARELLEECGIVVAGKLAGNATAIEGARRELLASEAVWPEMVRRGDVTLDARAFDTFGRWVTPPFGHMRFDAQYLRLDATKHTPSIWPGELDEGMWLTPQSALASHDAGNIFISYPVLETIRTIRAAHNDLPTASRAMEARAGDALTGGEMLTGVHVLPLESPTLPPATHTNVYTLGHHDVVIVDPAPTDAKPQHDLVTYLERLRASGVRLREIWLTHHHPDHVGSAMLLRDRFGIPIAAHELTAHDLQGTVKVDRFIADGDVTRMPLIGDHFAEWTAVFTPGHARGHLCFFDTRMRTLLAGDLLASVGTIIVAHPDGDMRDYMASLAKVRALNPRLLFPAHGPPVGAIAKIDEYIAHRTARENAILEALALASTAHDIVPLVYTDIPEASWPLAEINVQAVLDKLSAEGRIRKSGHGYLRSSA